MIEYNIYNMMKFLKFVPQLFFSSLTDKLHVVFFLVVILIKNPSIHRPVEGSVLTLNYLYLFNKSASSASLQFAESAELDCFVSSLLIYSKTLPEAIPGFFFGFFWLVCLEAKWTRVIPPKYCICSLQHTHYIVMYVLVYISHKIN